MLYNGIFGETQKFLNLRVISSFIPRIIPSGPYNLDNKAEDVVRLLLLLFDTTLLEISLLATAKFLCVLYHRP